MNGSISLAASFRRASAVTFTFALVACSSAPREDDEAAASTTEALTTGDYAYFFAERAYGRDGYVVHAANRARIACGAFTTDRCYVSSIDLSPLGTTADDASTILGTLRAGWEAASLVLVGQ